MVLAPRRPAWFRWFAACAIVAPIFALVVPVSVPPAAAAVVFGDGFESGNLAAWTGSSGFTVQQATVRSGAWAGRASSTGSASHAWRTIPAANEVTATVWFRVESRSSAVWLSALRRSSGAVILLVGLDAQGRVLVRNAVTKTSLRSSTTVPAGSWHELTLHAVVATAGRFDVALDGAAVPGLARTADLGALGVGRVGVGDPNSGRTYRVAFDDVVVDTAGGPPPSADPSVVGKWSAPVDIGVVGVHAILLHTGKVLLYHRTVKGPTSARLFDPATGAVSNAGPSLGLEYDLFCSAHVTRADGELYVVGGTLWDGPNSKYGTDQTAFFDPESETWRAGPDLAEKRWYPTTTTTADGDVFVMSGHRKQGDVVASVERFDGVTESISKLPKSADLLMGLYPRMFFLPDGRLIRVGTERETVFFHPSSSSWTQGPSMSIGRNRGSAVLLPGLDRILAIGGSQGAATTSTTEVLDLGDPTPAWEPTASMHEARRNFSVVLLPDGKVFVAGGNQAPENYADPVRSSELYDPQADTWTLTASQQAPRAYHSTAVLLPDGRVLSAGQNDGSMQKTAEIYSPPYLFAGPRPTITDAPADVAYGASFEVDTPDAATVDEVVLIRPGSVTHGVNFDQRSVELGFTRGASSLTVDAPASGFEAPPGMYLLFLVRDGVPSIASWVGVG